MKKKLSILFTLLISFSLSNAADSTFSINGNFNKVKSGKIYLLIYYGDTSINYSAAIKNGTFNFSGNINTVGTGILSYKKMEGGNENNYFSFFIEPAKINISGDGDSLKALQLQGSAVNDDDKVFKSKMKYIYDWQEKNDKIYEAAHKNKNDHILDSLDEVDNDILKEKRKVVAEFVKEHSTSMRSAMAITENYAYYAEADDVEPLYDQLSDTIKNSAKGKEIKKLINTYQSVAIGKVAPDIIQNTPEEKPLSLSSLRGKYVLIDFWASWCGPCRRENPNVVKTYAEFKDKGFEIFSVSYDMKKDKWEKAIKDDNLTWHHVSDLKGWNNSTSDQYGIKAIPSNVLLDKDGKIIAKNLFGKKLSEKLGEVIK